jgi:hypothetical protein
MSSDPAGGFGAPSSPVPPGHEPVPAGPAANPSGQSGPASAGYGPGGPASAGYGSGGPASAGYGSGGPASAGPAGPVGVPAPPAGPGASPPFAAPPTDRNRRGLWIGLGIGGLVLLLCCVGGVFGIGVLYVGATDQAKRQATAVVQAHLDALIDGDFRTAHDQFCDELARDISRDELQQQMRSESFTDYRLEDPRLGTFVEVTAHLRGRAGEVVRTYLLDTAGQELQICGIR